MATHHPKQGGTHLDMLLEQKKIGCSNAQGTLPCCAPLATPYVPFQENQAEMYQPAAGFIKGTIYPGLDLPFMGMTNQKEKSKTTLHTLQSYNFAISELGLYLDTHQDDQDTVDLYNQYVEQFAKVLQQYEREHGSTTQMGAALTGKYEWLNDPWPWDYQANQGG